MPLLILLAFAFVVVVLGPFLFRSRLARWRQYRLRGVQTPELALLIRALPALRWEEGVTVETGAKFWQGRLFGRSDSPHALTIQSPGALGSAFAHPDLFQADLFGEGTGLGGSPVEAAVDAITKVFIDPEQSGRSHRARELCRAFGLFG